LAVPNHFFDAQAFLKKETESPTKPEDRFLLGNLPNLSLEQILHKQRVEALLQTSSHRRVGFTYRVARFPYLEAFEAPILGKGKARLATLVTSKYAKTKTTSVDELLRVLQDPGQHEHQRFVVKGYILNFSNTTVKDIVKKVAGKKVLNFNDKCADEGITYIYHFIANIRDASVENDQRSLNVYILSNEEDQHLFDLWELLPGPKEIAKWKALSKHDTSKFEQRLVGLTNPEVEVKMVVELLITASGKAFFKLYDTIFV